jgi:hypothetical protein
MNASQANWSAGCIVHREVSNMNKLFFPTVLCLCVGLAASACAQDPQQPPPRTPQQQQQPQSPAQKVTVTGCLAKGSDGSQYVVTDQKSNEKLSFSGSPQLDKYLNQTVKLTGSVMTRDSGEKIFQPESIATVAPSCDSSSKQ